MPHQQNGTLTARTTRRAPWLAIALVAAACGGGGEPAGGGPVAPVTPPGPAVTPRVVSVSVSPTATTVIVGTPATLQAQVVAEGGASTQVTWSSSNPAIASVDAQTGVVRAHVGYDSVTVTARSVADAGKAASALVRVQYPPAPFSVSATPTALTIAQGQTGTVLLRFQRAPGFTAPIRIGLGQWASGSDAPGTPRDVAGDTATVALRVGTTLPATYPFLLRSMATGYHQLDVPVAVTVIAAPAGPAVASVTVAPAAAAVTAGQTVQLAATVRDASGAALAGRTVTWSTSNAAVVTVSTGGVVTGVAPGTAVVTATSTDNPVAVARATITVTPPAPTTFALAVAATPGSAAGTVTSTPAGITCAVSAAGASSGACVATFAAGTAVRLDAVPTAAGGGAALSGACTGTATCTVAMTADRVVQVGFATPAATNRTLTVRVAGAGTVTGPGGIACTAAGGTCSATLPAGTAVTLVAQPGGGAAFGAWGEGCAGTTLTCTLTLASDRAVSATFAAVGAVRVAVSGLGGVVGPGGIACGATGSICAASFTLGTAVTLTASAGAGQSFAGWGGACAGTSTACTLTVAGAHDVTAQFVAATRRLSVTVGGPGTVSGPGGLSCGAGNVGVCAAMLPAGTAVTLTAAPAGGARLEGWGGACAGTSASCAFTLDTDRSASATFTAPPALVALTVRATITNPSAPASVSISGGGAGCTAQGGAAGTAASCSAQSQVEVGATVTFAVGWLTTVPWYGANPPSVTGATCAAATPQHGTTPGRMTCTATVGTGPVAVSATY